MVAPSPKPFNDELTALVHYGRELRTLEFKRSFSWTNRAVQLTLAKTALAMSNIEDGGTIVVGVEERDGGLFEPVGMGAEDYESFSSDDVLDFINRFADPPVEIVLSKGLIGARMFVVIQVLAFREIPTICRRDDGPRAELREGAIYTRPYGTPRTAEVRGQTDMREIMDRAVDKGVRRLLGRVQPLIDARRGDTLKGALDTELEGLLDD
ncbi:MAG: hypothetical protein GEU28_10095 [Dehalococcoidia bacterium]|nr:hypothetical protein [Dehalococcoidia bacterium]